MKFILALILVLTPLALGDGAKQLEQAQALLQASMDLVKDYPGRLEQEPACDSCAKGAAGMECQAIVQSAISKVQQPVVGQVEVAFLDNILKLGIESARHAHASNRLVGEALTELSGADKDPAIQLAAAAALGAKQDPSIALPALFDLLNRSEVIRRKKDAELEKLAAESMRRLKEMQKAIQKSIDTGKRVRRLKESEKAVMIGQQALIEIRTVQATVSACWTSISSYRDDRCTAVLLKQTSGWEADSRFGALFEALLRNGTKPCLKKAVAGLKMWEARSVTFDKQVKKVKKSRAPREPKYWKGTRESWKARCELKKQIGVDFIRANQAGLIAQMEVFHASMERLAQGYDAPIPEFSPRQLNRKWQRWLKVCSKQIPPDFALTIED